MKKRMKKVLALGLSVAMICGLSSTAMAAEPAPEQAVETEAQADSTAELDAAADADATEEPAPEQAAPETEAETVEAGAEASVVTAAPNLLNGLTYAEDGNWYNFKNGVVDIDTPETLVLYNGIWWYVSAGKLDFGYEGLCKYNGTQWYVKAGQVQFGFSGFVQLKNRQYDSNEWYYIHDGKIDENYNDVIYTSKDGVEGWYCIENGKQRRYTVAANTNGWWFVNSNGLVDFNYTGIGYNQNGEWYIKNGKVDFSYNGLWEDKYKAVDEKEYIRQYMFKDGKVDETYTGVYMTEVDGKYGWHGYRKGELGGGTRGGYTVLPNENGWWYIDTHGDVAWDYTGIGANENGEWYVKNGKVDFSYNGFWDNGSTKYPDIAKVVDGKVDQRYTGVVWMKYHGKWAWYGFSQGRLSKKDVLPNESGWWYVGEDGTVDFSYNGTGANENGFWKIKNGAVDFGFTGTIGAGYEGSYQYVKDGKIDHDLNDVVYTSVDGEYAWWHVLCGWITKNDNCMAQNVNGWWKIEDGKVDWDYTGVACNEYGNWFIRNGRVDFGANGLCKDDYDDYYYVQNGYVDLDYNDVVLTTLNNVTAWYVISNGMYDKNNSGIAYNANGTWYYENGDVDFKANGERKIDVTAFDRDDFVVEFTYVVQVNGGLVTDVRVVSTDTEK